MAPTYSVGYNKPGIVQDWLLPRGRACHRWSDQRVSLLYPAHLGRRPVQALRDLLLGQAMLDAKVTQFGGQLTAAQGQTEHLSHRGGLVPSQQLSGVSVTGVPTQ